MWRVTETPSMRERMLAGELYVPTDPELAEQSARAR
jgi:Maltose acetyltransferase